MTDTLAQTASPGRGGPAGPAATVDDQAVLQALRAACRLHDGPVSVADLVWVWAAELW
jgi:hypothetical protein